MAAHQAPHPWDSPGKNTGVGCHFLLQCVKVKSESEVAQSCLTLRDPMDCSCQAPLFMGFSRQGYWNGLPCPSPVDLPDPGIEPTSLRSPALADAGEWIHNCMAESLHCSPETNMTLLTDYTPIQHKILKFGGKKDKSIDSCGHIIFRTD